MDLMNLTDFHQLEAYYSTRLLQIANRLGKKVIVWQGINFLINFILKDK
jgi:hypothetical protein